MIKIGVGVVLMQAKITGKQGHVAHLADNAAHHLVRICHELIGWEIDLAWRIFNLHPIIHYHRYR